MQRPISEFQYCKSIKYEKFSCFGGVVFSVLATGPKGCRFEPGQGDGFLRAIKICSTPSFLLDKK
jgi:hypothetical protein